MIAPGQPGQAARERYRIARRRGDRSGHPSLISSIRAAQPIRLTLALFAGGLSAVITHAAMSPCGFSGAAIAAACAFSGVVCGVCAWSWGVAR